MTRLSFCFNLVLATLMTTGVAQAATTRDLAWPRGWHTPLSSSFVKVTTNWEALSKGCSNADTRDTYRWYWDSPSRAQHDGLDLRAQEGTEVYASADGRVTAASDLWGPEWRKVVLITHRDEVGKSWTVAYGHLKLEKNPRTGKAWQVDDVVVAGDLLGETWTPAVSGSAAHLHYGMGRGVLTNLNGSRPNSGMAGTKCTVDADGTVSPESTMAVTVPVPWVGGIVSWRNADGSRVYWQIVRKSGLLTRKYIGSSSVRNCLLDNGALYFGDQPARTLDQMPDQTNVWAKCS